MAYMSKVFLIKAASAISEIAESAKSKMGMGTSKQYDPRKADVNKNGETEAWEKAIAMKRGFKGAPKAKADCPCGEPNCDCSEEGTKKEAGAVSEAIETVGKKVGGMFAKGKEKGAEAGAGSCACACPPAINEHTRKAQGAQEFSCSLIFVSSQSAS